MFYLSVRLVGGPQAIVYLLGYGLFCLWDSDRLHEESFFVCIGFQGIKPASPKITNYLSCVKLRKVFPCQSFYNIGRLAFTWLVLKLFSLDLYIFLYYSGSNIPIVQPGSFPQKQTFNRLMVGTA